MVSYVGYPCSAGKFTKQALKNMGFQVIHVGAWTGGNIPWKPGVDYSKYADKPDIIIPFERTYPLESILEKTGEVDLVIQMDANQYLVGKSPVPCVGWAIDNHVCDYHELYDTVHLLFGAHSWGRGHTRPDFHWLPCAYSPQDHYPTGVAKEHDLAFVGVPYLNRIELLNELDSVGDVIAKVGLLGKEYNDTYNSARIGLCASVCGDLPMRVFENAAQGLMVLCDRQKDLEKLGLKDGEHYVGFDSTPEAVEKFKWLLDNPQEVERIAKSGQEALKKETYEQRIREMLSWL